MQRKYLAVLVLLLVTAMILPGAARGIEYGNGFADLSVTKLEVSKNPSYAGDSLTANFNVTNIGKKAISTNCEIKLETDGVSYPFNCNAIRPGEIRSYSAVVTYLTAGSYNVKVMADPKDLIRERNESNNIRETTLIVKDLPNINIYEFHCLGGYCSNNGFAIQGDPVGYGWAVQNNGLAAIVDKTITANISLNGVFVHTETYNNVNIPSGGYFADGGLIPGLYYDTPGIQTLRVEITLNEREVRDTDNNAEFNIEVVPLPPVLLPDLTNGGLNFEWNAGTPYEVTVHQLIDNIGDVTSAPADIGISIDGQAYTVRTIGSISPGGKVEDVFTIPANLIGGSDPMMHTVSINIDPANNIPEKREDNNDRSELVCYPPGKNPWCMQLPPNPLPVDISLSYGWTEQADSDSVRLNYYLTNNGPGILDAPVTLDYSTDAMGGIQTINKSTVFAHLGPGEQMLVVQEFSASDVPTPIFPFGYYHMWIEADAQNLILETDDNNNILIMSVCLPFSSQNNCYPPATPTSTPTP